VLVSKVVGWSGCLHDLILRHRPQHGFTAAPAIHGRACSQQCLRHVAGIGGESRRGMAIVRDLTEDEYNNIADRLLDDILEKLEAVEDSKEGFEVNASGDGVIHVVQDIGTWVLNKQTPSRQIWLSSPITGPTHYKLAGQDWICTKDGHKMVDRLMQQLYIQL
jgi:frataxin